MNEHEDARDAPADGRLGRAGIDPAEQHEAFRRQSMEVSASIPVDQPPHTEVFRKLSHRVSGPMLVAFQNGQRGPKAKALSYETRYHSHPQGQLMCIHDGLIRLRTQRGAWLLQPYRAAWLPPHAAHLASVQGVSASWNLFIAPAAARLLPAEPCILGLTDLALALICRAASWTWQEQLTPAQRRTISVLLDELRAAKCTKMHLPLPTDRRLLRIANAILESPKQQSTLEELAAWAGISPRTVNRLLAAELGMSFARWRQDAMLVHAVERLTRGESVSVVSDALGYASPSNFIAMFRRAFGESPARYLSQAHAQRHEAVRPAWQG